MPTAIGSEKQPLVALTSSDWQDVYCDNARHEQGADQRSRVEARHVTHAEKLLAAVDERLDASVELTLYGRAALHLGFPNPPPEYAMSRDVDAVMWLGQAEELAERTNFWDVIEEVNALFADQELYISHFFEESQ